jgi:UDP-N-acetylmuramoyl-tripeptide--D-alanyl-D-alanine ligase
MIKMTLADVAAAVGGTLAGTDPATQVTGPVEFDSRKIVPGGLFVALRGAQVDGHDYAGDALAAGAMAVLGSRRLDGVPMVLVQDPLAAMARLAREVVDHLTGPAGNLTVIGLTGSSGKTTTKDLLAQVTARLGATVAPAGSFNNELGHPYTALRASEATRFLVLEMGARGVGHIAHLCQVAPPRVGVVLNVGVAHVGEFGSVEAIAQAKGELIEALPEGGFAVLNLDDPRVAAMTSRTSATVVGYRVDRADADGAGTGNNPAWVVHAEDIRLDERGRASYRLVAPAGTVPVRLGISGAHQVGNTLAVAAVALALGAPLQEVTGALGELRVASPRRMDVFDRPDQVTVVDDSYNANPASVAVALRALVAMGRPAAGRRRRTMAVLGYLAELGHHERAGHEEVGRLAAELGVDRVVVVGDAAAPIHHAAVATQQWGGESVLVADQAQAIAVLADQLRADDVVLVKGSRYQTWDVADWLRLPATAGAAR